MEDVTWRKRTKTVSVRVNVVLSVNLIMNRRNPHTNRHETTSAMRCDQGYKQVNRAQCCQLTQDSCIKRIHGRKDRKCV